MISLKEIGRLCGISESTVCKALKDNPAVNSGTRQRVLQVARAHGYQPNALVQGIQSGRTRCLGVAINSFGDPFSGLIMRGAQRFLHAHDYDFLIFPWDLMAGRGEDVFHRFARRRIDGMLLFPPAVPPSAEMIAALRRLGGPVVTVDQEWPEVVCAFAGSDNLDGGRKAAQLLLAEGRRSIACLARPEISSGRDRLRGAQAALQEAGVPLLPQRCVAMPGDDPADPAGRERIRQLLRGPHRPDGLLCFNDWLALMALEEAAAAGLAVPEDLSIVGCGNLPQSRLARPQLTTLDQSPEEIGEAAARLLLAALTPPAAGGSRPTQTLLPMQLLIRGTTRQGGAS